MHQNMIGRVNEANLPSQVVTCANTQVCVWIEGKPIVEGKTTTVTQWKCAEEWEASGFGDVSKQSI